VDPEHEEISSSPSQTLEIPRPRLPRSWVLDVAAPDALATVPLEYGRKLVLGSGRLADVRLSDRAVSARHCAVSAGELGVTVEDLGSTNGLYVGSSRLGAVVLTEEGSGFVIGRTSVTLRRLEDGEGSAPAPEIPGLIGRSPAMRRVAEEVQRHARSRATVLLQGESGTGKDVVARALHTLSRRGGEYVPINVGAFPDSLADSELFGHRRGAYTGAISNRAGAFELAHRGTLFLDEVAELSAAAQVKLLRVVEEGAVRPIGASHPVRVDVRVISASWAALPIRVAEGRFRVDLFHRLATVTIELPPLRRRKSDIPLLARVLLGRLSDDVGEKQLSGSALSRLLAHDWPGNVRELSAVLYRAAMRSPGVDIQEQHVELPEVLMHAATAAREAPERAFEILDAQAGNVSAAARAAGVPRSTFRSWLARPLAKAQNRPNTLTPPSEPLTQGSTPNVEDSAWADSAPCRGAVAK
jgi:transcriptional regulator with AAA-type ATPase domain